jgi:hypothetical protein
MLWGQNDPWEPIDPGRVIGYLDIYHIDVSLVIALNITVVKPFLTCSIKILHSLESSS